MSAWYVFTALGFYPVTPASDVYAIGRPFVERATLHLANGKVFTVSAAPLDDAHPYVGEVTLNGEPLGKPFLRHGQILAGGELHFRMQAEPARP
jgi:putative alpha-1,2-mannosidase